MMNFNGNGLMSEKNHVDKFVVRKNNRWDYLNYKGKLIKENISQKEIKEEYASFEINNYDFKYIVFCLVKVKKINH
jgi:hypothetical protein